MLFNFFPTFCNFQHFFFATLFTTEEKSPGDFLATFFILREEIFPWIFPLLYCVFPPFPAAFCNFQNFWFFSTLFTRRKKPREFFATFFILREEIYPRIFHILYCIFLPFFGFFSFSAFFDVL